MIDLGEACHRFKVEPRKNDRVENIWTVIGDGDFRHNVLTTFYGKATRISVV